MFYLVMAGVVPTPDWTPRGQEPHLTGMIKGLPESGHDRRPPSSSLALVVYYILSSAVPFSCLS